MGNGVEETNSGVKKKGNWKEVAEFGDEVEKAMEDADVDEESRERFDEWRPKTEEAENDMKKKTVENAVVRKKAVEDETDGVRKDLKEASGKFTEAGKKAAKRETPEPELVEASEEAARPFVSKAVKFFRRFESLVYSWFSLRGKRYYLDTDDFSVDMKADGGEYEMDLNIPEKERRDELKKGLGSRDE